MSSNSTSNITVYKARELTLNFPDSDNEYIKDQVEKTKNVIKENGIYTSDGKAFVDKKSVPHLLATDTKSANRIYNNLDDEDKFENGTEKYISVDATQKELSKRIQEPRDTNEIDRLKYSEKAIVTLRDAPELEKKREQLESHIRKELPKIKKKKRKMDKIDDITGDKLDTPEVHHKDRVADKPRKALDNDNLATLNKPTHKKLHKLDIETREEYDEYKLKKGLD